MNRRSFLQLGSMAGISLAGFSLARCVPSPKNNSTELQFSNSFALDEHDIQDLQQKMESGVYSSVALVQLYLQRIQSIDRAGPQLNSVIELNPNATQIADALDKERKEGSLRGPLHGIPVLIKDNINTADGMQTTAGSLALEGHHAQTDAFIVSQLREAGAVIIGKTNLSEWANFRSTRSISGWSSRGGQTRNPYVLDRTPCGSSSGSAVAVSANLCTVSVGTETDGSIACPASMCGIVGIKPTIGLVSRSGIVPISHSQDTAGPFGRTVRDAATLLGVLVGIDPDDASTQGNADKIEKDYTKFLDTNGLHNKRIGVEKSFLKLHNGIDTLLQKSIAHMKELGATLVEVDFMSKQGEVGEAEFERMKFEFKDGLNRYLASSGSAMKSLQDVIEFNIRNETRVMPYFKQDILENSQAKGSLDSIEYKELVTKMLTLRHHIDQLMKDHQLDALCGPATGPSWCIDFVNGAAWTGYGTYSPAAATGYPSITLPLGYLHGQLPVGISFLGRAFTESTLISIAYALEQATKIRINPKFNRTFLE